MKKLISLIFFCVLTIFCCSSNDDVSEPEPIIDSIYFPSLNSNEWDTISISELGWNENAVQPLLDYLETKNTKSFMILHHGKIVIEKYMNAHTASTPWYWASAGKTLTTTLSGIAQEDGLLNINNKVSDYLGNGWTNASVEKENLITCKHLLSMTSGLDDNIGNSVSAENLIYISDAGQRWAYHNVYKKMQDVVAAASNSSWTNYFNNKLKNVLVTSALT